MEREYANTNIIALNACAFASTFYFSHYTMQPHEKIKRASKPTHTTVQGFVQTSNSGAMNVNRFELLVCRLQTVVLRTNSSGDADNKGFKEMAGEVLNQTVVLLIKCSGRLTVCASKPPLLKPPKRYRSV